MGDRFIVFIVINNRKNLLINNLNSNQMQKYLVSNKLQKKLLIPTYIWASQKFLSNNSVLVVLCDKLFSEDEYIRNIDKFKKIKKKKKTNN